MSAPTTVISRSIPLSRPDITEDDIARSAEVLRTGMLVQGRVVEGFETAVSEFLGGVHVRAVANGTAALQLALLALGIGPGDEVVVPAFSFVATANVVELVHARPVFVDIDIATYNIDVARIESAITTRTKAIMPVHEFGLACDIEAVRAIAERHGLAVVEDAACALGALAGGRQAGTFGTLGCFSLHPRKAVTSGEGGLVVTSRAAYAEQIGLLRNHGIADRDGGKEYVLPGFNYRLTEFQAALVASQFTRLPRNLEYRRALATVYESCLDGTRLRKPTAPADRVHAWQTYHVLLDSTIDRRVLMQRLQDVGIQTSLGAQCIPAQQYYRCTYGFDAPREYPAAFRAWRHGLALPMSERLSKSDIQYVAENLNRIIS